MIRSNEYYRKILVETQRRGIARFLFEKEGEEEAETGDIFADDSAEEPPADSGEAEAAEAPAEGGEGEAEGEESEEEGEEESEEDEEPVEPDRNSIDNRIEAEFAKAEDEAINVAKSKSADVGMKSEMRASNESMNRARRSRRLAPLFEAPKKSTIDIEHFANSVARLVYNYDTLLDMEALVVQRAVEYIETNYDEEMAEDLRRALKDLHDIEVDNPNSPPGTKLGVPNAVGARQATA